MGNGLGVGTRGGRFAEGCKKIQRALDVVRREVLCDIRMNTSASYILEKYALEPWGTC